MAVYFPVVPPLDTLHLEISMNGGGGGGAMRKGNATPSLHNNQYLKCKLALDDDTTQHSLVVSVLNHFDFVKQGLGL